MLAFGRVFVTLVQPAMQQAVPRQFFISNFKRSPLGRTVSWARMALATKWLAHAYAQCRSNKGATVL